MEWLLLAGLVAVSALLLVALMTMLRTERRSRRLPTWIPAVGLVVAAALLVLSILSQSWLTAAGQALTTAVFALLLVMSLRRVAT